MITTLLITILIITIFCEFIDASIGMMYGTILTPVLLILGYSVIDIVPAILLSQAIGGFIASIRHNQYGNIRIFKKSSTDLKIALTIFGFGILGIILGVFLSLNIPKEYIKIYIGILVLIMGIIVLINKKFIFSWKKIYILSILSSFNKALSGGGFGPLMSTGLIVSGKESKSSIGITDMAEVPICLSAFIAWLILNNATLNMPLLIVLCIGASIGSFIGPYATYKLDNKILKIIVGIVAVVLGIICIFGAKI